MARRHRYTYRVVTNNGAGVHARDLVSPASARAVMTHLAATYPLPDEFFEIERVRHLDRGTVQYQMRQRSRWVEWDPHRKHTDREPDWFAISVPKRRTTMTDYTPSDEAVEAGARAEFNDTQIEPGDGIWEEQTEGLRDLFRTGSRVSLTAAVPLELRELLLNTATRDRLGELLQREGWVSLTDESLDNILGMVFAAALPTEEGQ